MPIYIDEDKYPEDYGFLPKGTCQALCEGLDRQFSSAIDGGMPFSVLERRIECLNGQGIFPERGWCGHRSGYFLATRQDAIEQADYLDELYWDSIGDIDDDYDY